MNYVNRSAQLFKFMLKTHKGLCITIIASVADVGLKNNSSVFLETHFYGFLKKDHETFAYSINGFCINSCTLVSVVLQKVFDINTKAKIS